VLGETDGEKAVNNLEKYAKRCEEFGVLVGKKQYLKGNASGLKKYCVEEKALDHGRHNLSYKLSHCENKKAVGFFYYQGLSEYLQAQNERQYKKLKQVKASFKKLKSELEKSSNVHQSSLPIKSEVDKLDELLRDIKEF
jgi:hypothetical protein